MEGHGRKGEKQETNGFDIDRFPTLFGAFYLIPNSEKHVLEF
jgi:hypothetical protein